jgi:hypothetical protein
MATTSTRSGLRQILCNSDSKDVIRLLSAGYAKYHKYGVDIRELLSRNWVVQIPHTYREANTTMAKFAARGNNGLTPC